MVDLTTQQKILDIAKKEFLEKGFERASLRQIVKEAGFTLGAFYGYYSNKEALFNAIVEEPASLLWEKYRMFEQQFFGLITSGKTDVICSIESRKDYSWLTEIIESTYENYEIFKLIFCRSGGTAYENYLDRLIQAEIDSTKKVILLLKESGHEIDDIVDDTLVHILTSSMFDSVYEVFNHDLSRDDALRYARKIQEYHTAGWLKMLRL